MIATRLAQAYCSQFSAYDSCVDSIDANQLYKRVMGNVQIVQITDPLDERVRDAFTCVNEDDAGGCPEGVYQVSRGFTSGDTIYDIYGPKRYRGHLDSEGNLVLDEAVPKDDSSYGGERGLDQPMSRGTYA